MTTIYHDEDADPAILEDQAIAVVGYGNQGRSWALNLRDTGLNVRVHVRADDSQEQARQDGFEAGAIEDASDADVICLLVPDDVIPNLPIDPGPEALVIVASGYSVGFGRFDPGCDIGMVAPRMLGPEVRECYLEDVGFITAVGVEKDLTGTAQLRTLAIAQAIGGLKQGAIEMTAHQEAVLDLAVEQVLAPGLRLINLGFTQVMAEHGIPVEAIQAELFLSGEMERTFRRLRLEGYTGQLGHHSPTSQYGQLSRADEFSDIDVVTTMRELVEHISSGAFADEWDEEAAKGYPTLEELRAEAASPELAAYERELREQLGETAARTEVGANVETG